MKAAQLFLVSMVVLATAIRPFAQITIGSTPGSNAWGYIENSTSGGLDTRTLAQVIGVPGGVDSTLQQFSFRMKKDASGDVDFTAAIAEWSGVQLVNTPPVWKGTGSTSTIAGAAESTATFSYSPNVPLNGTKTYALLIFPELDATGSAYTFVSLHPNDPANTDAGSLYYLLQAPYVASVGGLVGLDWDATYASTWDLEFQATFSSVSAVPEPSIPGLALGLSGLAGYAAWRRKRTATLSCAHQGASDPAAGPSVPLP
jgi:MYXO-CTERM domain-containing protein